MSSSRFIVKFADLLTSSHYRLGMMTRIWVCIMKGIAISVEKLCPVPVLAACSAWHLSCMTPSPCTIITSASRLEQGNHYPIRPPFYFSLTDPIPLFVLCPMFSSFPLLSCRDPPYPFFAMCYCSVCHHPLPTFHIFVPCLFCFVPDVCTFTLSSFLFVFLSYAAILYYFCFSSSSSPSFSSALLLPSLSHYREEEQTEVITAPKNETAATPGFTPEASPNENKDDEKDSLPLMKAPPTFYQPQLCIRHSPFPLSQTSISLLPTTPLYIATKGI